MTNKTAIHRFFMKKTALLAGLMLLSIPVFCQKTTTPEEAAAAALQNHPTLKAAALDVQAKKFGEKSALNLPNPEINAESPTGEFYAVGVLQSFEFPTVYARQKDLAKAETALAQFGQRVTENDLRFAVRSLYLAAQTADLEAQQSASRDSLYQKIGAAAARQFDAGEIDFLQKTLTENEVGQARQARLAAERNAAALRNQLAVFIGKEDLGQLSPLRTDTVGLFFQKNMGENPSIAFEKQAAQVAENQIGLAESRALPNFSLGYLNQGARNTPIDYRFRASVGIPLWVGQYRAGINAAKTGSLAALARADAQSQAVALETQRAEAESATALAEVQYFEREAVPRSRSLIDAAVRMREAGQVDYPAFLRTLDAAFAVQREAVLAVNRLNAARFKLMYLLGQ